VSASPNGKRPPRAAAFFDLDKTLIAGSSGVYFARAAYETGMISRGRLARDVYENLRFRLRGSTDERADDVRRRVGAMIAGVRVRDLERLSPRVLAACCRACIRRCSRAPTRTRTRGSRCSSSRLRPRRWPICSPTCSPSTAAWDPRSEIVDGRYTGRPAGPFNYREGKVLSMQEVAARECIDLDASYAYSDSESDVPMLRAVRHAVVVTPTPPQAHRRRGRLGGRAPRPPRASTEAARGARRRDDAGVPRPCRARAPAPSTGAARGSRAHGGPATYAGRTPAPRTTHAPRRASIVGRPQDVA